MRALVVAVLAAAAACVAVTSGAVIEVASGFAWAENLICDQQSASLFVSEFSRGELYRITFDAKLGAYNASVHVSGYNLFAGLAIDDKGTLYAIAKTTGGDAQLLAVDKTQPDSVTVVTTFPKVPNGLAWDSSSQMLYATVEGDFLPDDGSVWSVDPTSGAVRSMLSNGWACDGAFVDPTRHILYVSQVLDDKMLLFNTSVDTEFGTYDVPKGISNLDDFTLSRDGLTVYGAGFLSNSVAAFASNGTGVASTLLDGLQNPTSVRWGCGVPGFPTTSLFITEGGGSQVFHTTNRRVMQITNV